MGRILASEVTTAPFLSISCRELTRKFPGDGKTIVRHVFEQARAHQPAVVFLDDLDALFSSTLEADVDNDLSAQVKTELMRQLQEGRLKGGDRIKVVATTSAPWVFDVDLVRQFKKRLYLALPDKKTRMEVFKRELSHYNAGVEHEELNALAQAMEGCSGGEIRGAILKTLGEETLGSKLDIILRAVQCEGRSKEVEQFERFTQEFGEDEY